MSGLRLRSGPTLGGSATRACWQHSLSWPCAFWADLLPRPRGGSGRGLLRKLLVPSASLATLGLRTVSEQDAEASEKPPRQKGGEGLAQTAKKIVFPRKPRNLLEATCLRVSKQAGRQSPVWQKQDTVWEGRAVTGDRGRLGSAGMRPSPGHQVLPDLHSSWQRIPAKHQNAVVRLHSGEGSVCFSCGPSFQASARIIRSRTCPCPVIALNASVYSFLTNAVSDV